MKKFTSYKNKFDLKKFIKISKKEDDLLKCLSFAYGIKNDLDLFDGNIQAMGLERFGSSSIGLEPYFLFFKK